MLNKSKKEPMNLILMNLSFKMILFTIFHFEYIRSNSAKLFFISYYKLVQKRLKFSLEL